MSKGEHEIERDWFHMYILLLLNILKTMNKSVIATEVDWKREHCSHFIIEHLLESIWDKKKFISNI